MATIYSNGSLIDDTINNETSSYTDLEIFLSPAARFWILLSFEIPSLICALFLLYHLYLDRTLRRSLHIHVIIILLVVIIFPETADVPNYLTCLRLGYVWPQTLVHRIYVLLCVFLK